MGHDETKLLCVCVIDRAGAGLSQRSGDLTIAFYALIAAAIAVMLFALVQAVRLATVARGGYIGRAVRLMLVFVGLFTLTYLASPLLPLLPAEYAVVLTAAVFLLGAVFVALVLNIIRALIKQVFEELNS